MKNKILVVMAAAVMVVGLAGCFTIQAGTAPQIRSVYVSGTGQVYVTPDVAYINIGVQTKGDTVTQALDANTAAAQSIRDTLKEQGVEEKDIQTSGFSIYPMQDYGPDGTITREYFSANNTVYVTVRELGKMGGILDVVARNGANTINGITFDVLNKEQALAEARQIAMEDAKKQAIELANTTGDALGEVQNISVYTSTGTSSVYEGKGGGMAYDASMPVPIATGQMVVVANVSITYELK
jgi:uncharacterized protein YggE